MNKTKHSLFMSAISLLLCISMLLGTTFAWFTDEVVSTGNKIQSGTLKVDLELLDEETGKWNSLKETKAPIFNHDKWEPGYVDTKILKVENEGNLALKWVAQFYSANQLSILADAIDVYVRPSETEIGYPAERNLDGYTPVGSLRTFINSIQQTTWGTLEAKKSAYLGIALKMREDAGNEYQNLSLGGAFDIRIYATQHTAEKDSFDNQYDKNATFEDLANTSLLATETKTLAAGADSVEFNLASNGMTIAAVTVPASAIEDPSQPVTVTFDGIDPTETITVGENTKAYAFDISVTNLKKDLADDQLVTMVVAAPVALAELNAYHNGALIEDAVYDEVAGTITFQTASFSPYAFEYTEMQAGTLEALRAAVKESDVEIKLTADLEIDLTKGTGAARSEEHVLVSGSNKYYNAVNITGQNVAIDLNGHKITVKCGDAYNSNSDVGALFFVSEGGSLNIIDRAGGGFIKMASSIYAVWAPYADPSYVDIYGGAFIADSYAGDPIGTSTNPGSENGTMANENSNRALIYAGFGGKMRVLGGYFLYNNTPNDVSNRNNGAFNAKDFYEGATPLLTIHDGVMLINKEYKQNPKNTSTPDGSFDEYSVKLAEWCEIDQVSHEVKIGENTYSTWYRVSSKEPVSLTVNGATMYTVGSEVTVDSVTVLRKDGTTVTKTDGITIGDVDMSFSGKKTVTVTYTEGGKTITADFTINVTDDVNALIASPKKQTYNIGDTVVKTDFAVSAVAADGSKGDISDYSISDVDTSTTGTKTVTISFTNPSTGKVTSTTCTINVLNLTKVTGNDVPTIKYWHAGNFAASNNWNHAEVPGTGYESYVGETYKGKNGEIATGFNLTGHTAAQPMSGYNNLTVTNAKPYSLMGINGTVGFENAAIKSIGYYVDGDLSTVKTNGTLVPQGADDIKGNYATAYIVQANLYDFVPGSTHTITYVVEIEEGFIDLCQWTVTMAAASSDAFVDTDKPNVNVIVIAGQSNACGASPITQSMKDLYSNVNYQNVYMQYKNTYVEGNNIYTACESAAFEKYYYGMGGFQSQHFGPEAGLAYYLATNESTKNEQWFIVKYAATGTTITQWINGVMLADELTDFVKGAIEPLTADYDVQIRSLLWMQGETDACEEGWANAYKANEQKLVTNIRTALAAYATRTDAGVAGSGISFINAGIAPNSLVGQQTNGLVGNEVADGGRNDWEHAATVNWAKYENAEHWYLPNVTGGGSVFGGGIPAGWYYTNQGTPGIINSAYIDTYTLISKNEADSEKAEYVLESDKTDWAHYSSASMVELGKWFGESLTYVMGKNTSFNNSSSTSATTYTVTYNANGGTVSPDKVVVAENKAITLLPATREGYTFKGWSDGQNTYAAGAEYTVTGNVTLTAQWAKLLTVTFNANGGSCGTAYAIVDANGNVTLPNATREGYTFYGWYTAETGGTYVGVAGASYNTSAEVTLYAQWQINSYRIDIQATSLKKVTVNGTNYSSNKQITVTYGSTVTVKENNSLSNPTVTVTHENGTVLYSGTNGSFTMPAGNVTITVS